MLCCLLFTDSSYFNGKTIKIIGFFSYNSFVTTLDNPVFGVAERYDIVLLGVVYMFWIFH